MSGGRNRGCGTVIVQGPRAAANYFWHFGTSSVRMEQRSDQQPGGTKFEVQFSAEGSCQIGFVSRSFPAVTMVRRKGGSDLRAWFKFNIMW